ncbi:MAG TPA: serine hydrolase domain-containing protein [Allosphingosinicella sp.]
MEIRDPEEFGFDAGRLARTTAFLQETYVAPGLLPCAQLLVARDGEPVHFTSLGIHRQGSDYPLREDAIFRVASMTKPVTSLAFMMLVEEGKTSLDQPVAAVIPELENVQVHAGGGADGAPFRTVPPERPMLMVDLLRHTSGLTYDFQQMTAVDAAYRERGLVTLRGKIALEPFVAALGEIPLEFSPGTAWNYSVSTDVLALVVERLAGMPFEAFIARRIFEPLGMVDTSFTVPPEKLHRLTDAWMLHPERGTVLYDKADESSWSRPPTFVSGGGGLVSTVADYHLFCRMLLNRGMLGGERIVSRKTMDLMTANHLPGGADLTELSRSMFSEAIYSGQGFGLGFGVNMDPVKAMAPGSAGEFYWGGIFSTFFFVDPVERVTMVFMTQLMPSSTYPVRRQLRTLIYAALE